MKKYLFLVLIPVLMLPRCSKFVVCNPGGEIVRQSYTFNGADTLISGANMVVEIISASENKIEVEGYENIVEHFRFNYSGKTLRLDFDGNCFLRDEKNALKIKVFLTDVKVIRNSGEYRIFSRDTLRFERLTLVSENSDMPDSPALGDFDLKVDVRSLSVVSNNLSMFYLQGHTDNLFVGFYAGLSRFEGKNLTAEKVYFIQKSSNDMLFYPVIKLEGDIYSTGNVVIYHRPDTVKVREHFKGKLIRAY